MRFDSNSEKKNHLDWEDPRIIKNEHDGKKILIPNEGKQNIDSKLTFSKALGKCLVNFSHGPFVHVHYIRV